MKFYKINGPVEIAFEFAATFARAKEIVNQEFAKVLRADVKVREVEILTDKDSILEMLNSGMPTIKGYGRTWHGSARGALKEELPEDRSEAAAS